jgi:threonylcarbamoyladenosine tRNA methylthiotransferase MtaB
MPKTKIASFYTLGCRLNQAETAIISKGFADKGFVVAEDSAAAAIAVINTCTVTENADAKCRNMIRRIQRRNPDTYIAVVGCYSQMAAETIASIDGVDLIVGNQEKMQLANIVTSLQKNTTPEVRVSTIRKEAFAIHTLGQESTKTRANLKIQDGCDFMCSFCIIPFARGRSRPRDWANLCAEAKTLTANGNREIVLTGVNIGTFDLPDKSIVDVVDMLDGLNGLERIRISSIEPTTIPDGIIERMADPGHKLVPFLHIPLQSGSDTILKEMRRLYTRQEWEDFIVDACKRIPDVCIGTDVMVGFPGETTPLFRETKQFLADLPIAYFHVFNYSERKGTKAVKLPNKVTLAERQRRSDVLRELSERKRQQYNQQFIGRTLPVLFEEYKKEHYWGYTENYIRVKVATTADLKNQVHEVNLRAAEDMILLGNLGD